MGRLEDAVLALFTKPARVTSVERLAAGFSRVGLGGDALRGVAWTPGQKLQIAVRGLTQRTFTPMTWNADEGSTELLVYSHGGGPVDAWVGGLAVGAPCALFGPRSSLALVTLERPALFFGDETSFGLARALSATPRGASDATLLFEVTSREASEAALAALGIRGAELVVRRDGDAHASELEAAAESAVRRGAISNAVLSGSAPSIRLVQRRLKALGLARGRVFTKAYWAPGKAGLD